MSRAIIVEPLAMPAITASNTAAGYSPANAGLDQLGVIWSSQAGASSRYLQIDMGADVAFDTIALFGLTGANATWLMQIFTATAAQGPSFAGGYWASGGMALLAGSAMPTSGRGKALWQAPAVSPPPPSRYIRIVIDVDAVQPVAIGRVVVGRKIQLHRNFQFGAAFGVRDLGSAEFSARGVLLRRRAEKMRSAGISFPSAHRDEVEAIVHPLLERIGNTECVCMVIDPDTHEQRQNRMYFGPLVGDLGTVWARADGFEARVNIVGLDR